MSRRQQPKKAHHAEHSRRAGGPCRVEGPRVSTRDELVAAVNLLRKTYSPAEVFAYVRRETDRLDLAIRSDIPYSEASTRRPPKTPAVIVTTPEAEATPPKAEVTTPNSETTSLEAEAIPPEAEAIQPETETTAPEVITPTSYEEESSPHFVREKGGTFTLVIGREQPADAKEETALPNTGGRVAFIGGKNAGAPRDKNVPLRYECNGLIFDLHSWDLLAVPQSAFNAQPSPKVVDSFLADGLYNVFRIDEGSLVTLYSWVRDGRRVWALATGRGYDVSALRWIGPLTYAGVIHDLATRLYPDFVEQAGLTLEEEGTRLAFTNLNPRRCYTIGFRHHDFHPMLADPERIWQVQSVDLSGGIPIVSRGEGGLPGLPHQVPEADLPEDLTYADLVGRGVGAFETAAAGGKIEYGYILRARDPAVTREHSDILIESDLLARVRRLAYSSDTPKEVTHLTRFKYSAMRAFLTPADRRDFLAVYPDWKPRFRKCEEFVESVATLIIHTLRQRSMGTASREPELVTPAGIVARMIMEHICRQEKFNIFHHDMNSIVRDYVVTPEYALIFLQALSIKTA